MKLNVPLWIDLQWGLILALFALFSVLHKLSRVLRGRGCRGKVGVGAASRMQASACSTCTQIFHEGDQRQKFTCHMFQKDPPGDIVHEIADS